MSCFAFFKLINIPFIYMLSPKLAAIKRPKSKSKDKNWFWHTQYGKINWLDSAPRELKSIRFRGPFFINFIASNLANRKQTINNIFERLIAYSVHTFGRNHSKISSIWSGFDRSNYHPNTVTYQVIFHRFVNHLHTIC